MERDLGIYPVSAGVRFARSLQSCRSMFGRSGICWLLLNVTRKINNRAFTLWRANIASSISICTENVIHVVRSLKMFHQALSVGGKKSFRQNKIEECSLVYLRRCLSESFIFSLYHWLSFVSNRLVALRVFFAVLKPSCWQSFCVEFGFYKKAFIHAVLKEKPDELIQHN